MCGSHIIRRTRPPQQSLLGHVHIENGVGYFGYEVFAYLVLIKHFYNSHPDVIFSSQGTTQPLCGDKRIDILVATLCNKTTQAARAIELTSKHPPILLKMSH